MALQLSELWDFSDPELSRQRFLEALSSASPDEALILKTQIARSHGLRGEFPQALQILAEVEPLIGKASAEAQVRYELELGRCYSSATHPAESQTPDAREHARSAFLRAYERARAEGLDDLAIDAVHMMTFVDTTAERQFDWNRKALALLESSSQPAARKWEGPLRNNLGYSLHAMGRYEEALREFQLALAAREREGKTQEVRIAYWMIAWTLRALGRLDEAVAIQLRLERECDEAGEPDPYVFEELELLYTALHDAPRAEYYAARRASNGRKR